MKGSVLGHCIKCRHEGVALLSALGLLDPDVAAFAAVELASWPLPTGQWCGHCTRWRPGGACRAPRCPHGCSGRTGRACMPLGGFGEMLCQGPGEARTRPFGFRSATIRPRRAAASTGASTSALANRSAAWWGKAKSPGSSSSKRR